MSIKKNGFMNFDYSNINIVKVLGRIQPNKVKADFCLFHC